MVKLSYLENYSTDFENFCRFGFSDHKFSIKVSKYTVNFQPFKKGHDRNEKIDKSSISRYSLIKYRE